MNANRRVAVTVLFSLAAASLVVSGSDHVGAIQRLEPSARQEPNEASRPTPGKARGDEAGEIFARDEWFYQQRAYPLKHVPPGARLKARRQAADLAAARAARTRAMSGETAATLSAAAVPALNWTSLGPQPTPDGSSSIYNGAAPWSGRVTVIAHDPTNEAIAYLGGADGGVWRTTDSGDTWQAVFDDQPSLAIGSIALDPRDPTIVYVATGEANLSGDSYFGAGIFRSTQSGAPGTWAKIGGSTFDDCYIAQIVVEPGPSSNILVAAGNTGNYPGSCVRGLYRSIDGGTSFLRVLTGAPSDVVSKPGTPTIWYAARHGEGVWRSTNDGKNWARLTNANPLLALPSTNVGRIRLAVTPANPGRIYAAIADSRDDSALGVWTSTDGGGSWAQMTQFKNFCSYQDTDTGGQCSYDLAIAADPGNDTRVVVGGVRVQQWNGTTVTTLGYNGVVSTGIHVDIHSLSFDAANRLWVGSDGGAYRKDPGTKAMQLVNRNSGLSLTQFEPGISGSPNSLLLGGTQDNGTQRYTPADGWYEFITGDGGYTAYDPTTDYRFSTYIYGEVDGFVGDYYQGCLITTDPEWTCNFHIDDPALFYAPLVQSPSDPGYLYLGTDKVWQTPDDGTSWIELTASQSDGLVSAIAEAKSNWSVLYAAWSYSATGSHVRVSTDAGATWDATGPLPNRFITDIAIKTTVSGTAWVSLNGYNTATPIFPGHVFLTQDYGTTWQNISGDLPDVPVNALQVDSRTSPSTLYAATDIGVYWSSDGGTTWLDTSQGLPHSVVMDVLLDPVSNKLVAATHGRGMYVAPIPTTALVPVSIGDASVVEGESGSRLLQFTVSLSAVSAAPVSVTYATYATVDGPATAGLDYTSKSGSVTVPAGSLATPVSISVRGDTDVELIESFGVRLSNPVGATLHRANGTGRILNDDPSSGLRVAIGNASVVEGASGSRFLRLTVSLSSSSASPVSVSYATANGTAISGTDFTARSGAVTIAAGKTSTVVNVAVKGDASLEPTESFTVRLTNPIGAVIGRATGTATIINDD